MYRVSHLVIELGLVDFDYLLPHHFCQNATNQGRVGQTVEKHPSQPNQVYDQIGRPVLKID